jgi:hypothetical protein
VVPLRASADHKDKASRLKRAAEILEPIETFLITSMLVA